MSPLSMPTLAARPRPKRADDRMDIVQSHRQLPEAVVEQKAVPKSSIAAEPTLKLPASSTYDKNPFTNTATLSWLPSEMKRINTPPVENPDPTANQPGPFKSFFFDARSMPIEQCSVDSESPEPIRTKRRKAILPMKSLRSLLPKLSLPKLKRKTSTQPEESQRVDDPLEVTAFEQTPFSQRYGDTKRTKMSRIRSYLDEAMKESEEDEGLAMFEADVPDHLPSSPLCPIHPRHASGSAMICPIHRRKRVSAGLAYAKTMQKQAKNEPRIVFESDLHADRRSK